MTVIPLTLTGRLRQSEAEDLRRQAMAQIDAGALFVSAEGLESIELGPLQVLICAAAEARQLGLPCQLGGAGISAINTSLGAVRLPDASRFFTLVQSTEMSVPQ